MKNKMDLKKTKAYGLTTKQKLEKMKLKRIKTKKDGNCLFHAIAKHVKVHHEYIRRDICNEMLNNKDINKFIKKGVKKKVEKYVDKMSKNREWGTNTEAEAAAVLYKRNVVIFSKTHYIIYYPDLTSKIIRKSEDNLDYKSNNDITIYYNGYDHWDSIIKIKE